LRETASRLGAQGIEVLAADALGALGRQTPGSFDLVLLDPPYSSGLLARALGLAPALLAERGLIYAEDAHDPVPPPGWRALRRTRAGAVHAALLAREPVAADMACPLTSTDLSASTPSP
jgi:16S rRNA G966 N2-methylase RsmD